MRSNWLGRHVPHIAAALCALVVCLAALAAGMGSPFDEHTHFDYVAKVAQTGSIPPLGDELGQTSLAEFACMDAPAFAGLQCGKFPLDPKLAPWGGASVATSYAPTYYIPTAAVARAFHALGVDSWLNAARMANAVWLVVLTLFVVGIVLRLGGAPRTAFAGAVLACVTPIGINQSVAVGNDVAGALGVAIVIWAWLRLEDERTRIRLPVVMLLAVLALSIKETALLALLAVAFLEGHLIRERGVPGAVREPTGAAPRGPRAVRLQALLRFWPAVAMPIAAGLTFAVLKYLILPAVRGSAPIAHGMGDVIAAANPGTWDTLGLAYRMVVDVFTSPVAPLEQAWPRSLAVLLAVIAVGGVFFRVSRGGPGEQTRNVTAVSQALAAYFVFFPLTVLANLRLFGEPFFFQSRYFLPGAVIAAATFLIGASRGWTRLAGVAALGIVVLFVVILAPYWIGGLGNGRPWP